LLVTVREMPNRAFWPPARDPLAGLIRYPNGGWHCTGGPNQKWDTRGFRVHYGNPNAFNKVLDDPAFDGNGTRQELYDNNGGVNQLWATF
jgi:hypothetical protein